MIVTALGGAAVSAYLWLQAFSGGAEAVIRPPSLDAFRREIVTALVDLAEPRRVAAERAARGIRVSLGPVAAGADDRFGTEPLATPPPAAAPEPPPPGPREPGTPPTPPDTPPAGPAPGTPPAGPAPRTPPAGPAVPKPPSAPGVPAAVQPTAGTPVASSPKPAKGTKPPEKATKRERPVQAQAAHGATPAQPAIPPRPQEQKPATAPAATPAKPAVPPQPAEEPEHGHGNSGGNGKKP
jgi:hypothetical protein